METVQAYAHTMNSETDWHNINLGSPWLSCEVYILPVTELSRWWRMSYKIERDAIHNAITGPICPLLGFAAAAVSSRQLVRII